MMSLLDALAQHGMPVNLRSRADTTCTSTASLLGVMVESVSSIAIEPGTYRLAYAFSTRQPWSNRGSACPEALPYMNRHRRVAIRSTFQCATTEVPSTSRHRAAIR